MTNRYAALQGRYTVQQAAELAELHPNTLRAWIKAGVIPGLSKPEGQGRYVIWKEPFDAWRLKGKRNEEAA